MADTILHYDCFAGVSGDMNLAALIDLGVPADRLRTELSKLHLHDWELKTSRAEKMGIHGTRVDVDLHEHHEHSRDDVHAHAHHHHEHRTFTDIRRMIEDSSLSERVKRDSIAIFRIVAEAEAAVHARAVDEIHFHEVGAVDSIIDIVGAAIGMEFLNPSKITASPLELGGGFVKCAHGTMPIPAPATARILEGIPVTTGAVPFEMTTPTGAAIIRHYASSFAAKLSFTIRKSGIGVGHRDTEIPNLLRVYLAETSAAVESRVLIETNIDDMNPELYAHVMDRLFAEGADDVWLTPIIMKKSRPAVTLSVLCAASDGERISQTILVETTSLGLRKTPIDKTALERETLTVKTSLGEVRVKRARIGGIEKSKPEYDDCARIAKKRDMPLRDVYALLQKEI